MCTTCHHQTRLPSNRNPHPARPTCGGSSPNNLISSGTPTVWEGDYGLDLGVQLVFVFQLLPVFIGIAHSYVIRWWPPMLTFADIEVDVDDEYDRAVVTFGVCAMILLTAWLHHPIIDATTRSSGENWLDDHSVGTCRVFSLAFYSLFVTEGGGRDSCSWLQVWLSGLHWCGYCRSFVIFIPIDGYWSPPGCSHLWDSKVQSRTVWLKTMVCVSRGFTWMAVPCCEPDVRVVVSMFKITYWFKCWLHNLRNYILIHW